MKNKKVLALLVSLVLIVAVVLPGTLAVSSDQDGVDGSFTVPEEPAAPIDPEQPVDPEQPEQPVVEQPEQPVVEQPEQPVTEQEIPVEEPVVITHLDTCLEDCTGEECACGCHLFDKIMKCETQDALEILIAETPDEYFVWLTDEQLQTIEAHVKSLETIPLPAIVLENNIEESTVQSEIFHPTVNYAFVAPFGAPVTGGQG